MENKKVVRHEFGDASGIRKTSGNGNGGDSMKPEDYVTHQELNEATKDITHQIELLEAHLDTKFETVNTKIAKAQSTIIMWLIGTIVAVIALVIG